jgi:imidazolonepropionase-like amidohydrolase
MLAIINALIDTISNGKIEKGRILIKDGKIAAIGKDIDISK